MQSGALTRVEIHERRHFERCMSPIESLAEALAEGTITASDEPEFNFSGRDVGAIIAYMKMIQEP
jgi:hypothetical protein